MAKEYFPHDCSAMQDPKMVTLLMECGAFGVGLFWIIIELMHQQCRGISRAELSHYIDLYGKQGSYDQITLDRVREVLFSTKLLIEQDSLVCSERVINNLRVRAELIEKAKKAAEIRWGGNAVAMRGQCPPNAIKLNKIKLNKRKEEEAPPNPQGGFSPPQALNPEKESLFDEVWAMYPRKLGTKKARGHFLASVKTPKDLENIKKALENYLSSKTVKDGFIQHGSTWFNNWRDWIDFAEEEEKPKSEYDKRLEALRKQPIKTA